MFIIVDFNKGYYHIALNDANTFLTTFNKPFGRLRFTRMSYGLTLAGDTFQHKLHTIFKNVDFSTDIADDMRMLAKKPM